MTIISRREYIKRILADHPGASVDHSMLSPSGHMSAASERAMKKRMESAFADYNRRAVEVGAEYDRKLADGDVRAPTNNEGMIASANGHPDLESTQAARRVCAKRGIDWRTS